MQARTLLLAVAVLGLVALASPLVGTAGANVCDVDDVECHENKLRCHVRTVTNPTSPTFCTA